MKLVVDTSSCYVFQFQTGAIKSDKMPDEDTLHPSFNSKLVRLKGKERRNSRKTDDRFQFQTGAIKSIHPKLIGFHLQSFNSKLVRLKVSMKPTQLTGDIKVSIPNWCD